jgi:hypothetical protein
MKKVLLALAGVLLSLQGFAQQDSADARPWRVGGNYSLQFNQAAYSNWQAGGTNSITANSLVSLFANYQKGDWAWKNSLNLAYGLSYQEDIFNKTDDRIELESRVDRKFRKNWNFSALLNFRTQFTDGFDQPGITEDSLKVSGAFAPAYTVLGLGLTYKPNDKFNAFISPLTTKVTIVGDERLSNLGAFGVDTGSTVRFEAGGYVNLSYNTPIAENIKLQSKLDLFSNYLDGNYKFVDVNAEIILFMKVNKYITANVALNMVYDHDIRFDTNNDGVADAPRTQFREVIGVGFSYNFGDAPRKKK